MTFYFITIKFRILLFILRYFFNFYHHEVYITLTLFIVPHVFNLNFLYQRIMMIVPDINSFVPIAIEPAMGCKIPLIGMKSIRAPFLNRKKSHKGN